MRKIKYISLIIISAILIICSNLQAHSIEDEADLFYPVEIHDGTVLNIMDAVALAYKNCPKIRRQKYNLDIAKSNLGIESVRPYLLDSIAKSDLGIAKSRFFPVINVGTGIGFDRNSNGIYYDKRYRDLPAVGVSVNQLIYNFGKTTAYIKMEEFYKIGAEYEFMDSLCNTLFDVKAKYYSFLQAKALFNVAKNKFCNIAL